MESTVADVRIYDSKLVRCSFWSGTFTNVIFTDCDLTDTDFNDVTFKNVKFRNCTLSSKVRDEWNANPEVELAECRISSC